MDTKKFIKKLVTNNIKGAESDNSCEPCQPHHSLTLPDGSPLKMVTNCMTNRELLILSEMRQAREKADEIKRYLKEVDNSLKKLSSYNTTEEDRNTEEDFNILAGAREEKRLNDERQQLYYWLAKLREEWRNLDKRRVIAAEERMRLLGHVE